MAPCHRWARLHVAGEREPVRLLADSEDARAFLRRDPALWAWPLCTLGAREWPYVRLWVESGAEGRVEREAGGEHCTESPTDQPAPARGCSPLDGGPAGVWVLDHPGWGGGLQAFGEADALAQMLGSAALPSRAFVRTLPTAAALLEARYRFDWLEPIVRMHVTPETLIVPPDARLVVQLSMDDAANLVALYAHWPESRFLVSRLRQGYQYVGIRHGEQLVAVAEQTLSTPDDGGLAVVQGVLVDPGWRGRGLAGAVTASLTQRLFEAGFHDVVLDVRESNLAAQAAYARIGYRRHVTMMAGPGVLL